MSGLAIYAGRAAGTPEQRDVQEAINPLGLLDLQTFADDRLLASVGQHEQAPCRDVSFAAHGESLCLLAGDVVNHRDLDWTAICSALASGQYRPECLRKLRGSFCLVVVDRRAARMWIVTDPSAWLSVLTYSGDDGFIVSTSIAAILRALPGPASIDADWIDQSLFFNHGIGETSPLAGARRLPPGTITEVNLETFDVSRHVLHERPVLASQLQSGNNAIDEAIDVFRNVVPNYFPDDQPATLGISEGLDCRTVLAALPQDKIEGLHSFTFGKPSSSEITEAADIAAHLKLNHTSILLDQAFLDRLPALARDTVFLSGGQQNINRSHLLYTYGQLAYENRRYPLIATGVSGDHIFRDHIRGTGNIPHILSASAASQHHHGRQRVDRAFYASLVGDRFEAFEDRIERSLDHLQDDYGEFGDPESYLSYLMFEAGPRYFGGQTAIANAFSTFRTPYWDPEIISLGYRLQNATAGLSAAQPKKDVYLETRIQASVIAAHDTVGQLPYKDLPINVYARGSKARFQSHRLCRRLRSLLRRSRFIYSEDWRLWYQTSMRDEVRRLLGDDSRVREYVTPRFIEDAIATADVHWLGKLITTEHTLRFVETGWRQP